MRPLPLVSALALVLACGGPLPLKTIPDATLPPPSVKVVPPPGPFNDQVTLTFTANRSDATIFVSTDGSDPMKTSKNRLSGPTPFTVTLKATTNVQYFANAEGKDGALQTGTWTRAGGPPGTISGVVVVGGFATNHELGVFRNLELKRLGQAGMPAEVPFVFTDVMQGTHQLTALMDRNGDGQLTPLIDYASNMVTVTIDLTDPFKASAENVRLYLGSSQPDLGTLRGTITVPQPMLGTQLRVSALSASSFLAGFDPQTLLTQLQNGYQIFTNATDTQYPYVITDLTPGQYVASPVLLGFGAGGLAMNFLANPLQPANVPAGGEAVEDFAFGPVSISGTVTLMTAMPPQGFVYGVVAARTSSLGTGIQAVLMPTIFAPDPTVPMDGGVPGGGNLVGNYAGQALLANSMFAIKTFTSVSSMNPLTDALAWVVNPFAAQPPDVNLPVGTQNVVQDLVAH
jgi:hypothetical protein